MIDYQAEGAKRKWLEVAKLFGLVREIERARRLGLQQTNHGTTIVRTYPIMIDYDAARTYFLA